MNAQDSEYSRSAVRVLFPPAEKLGPWLRYRWKVESVTRIGELPADILVPLGDLADIPSLITVNCCRANAVLIDVYSWNGIITGDTMIYIGALAVRLKRHFGTGTKIDGMTDHPLFNLVSLAD